MTEKADALRSQIADLVVQYHDEAFAPQAFVPGLSPVPVSGRVFDAADIQSLVESSLDFWLTTGRFANEFEREFARFCGVRKALLVNSGSSADLVALTTLTSPKLGDRRLKPGDEVITVAAGFPTTVNPIIQNGLVPVFLDVTIPDYNLDITQLEEALSPKTRALMFAHTLGNPGNMTAISEFRKKKRGQHRENTHDNKKFDQSKAIVFVNDLLSLHNFFLSLSSFFLSLSSKRAAIFLGAGLGSARSCCAFSFQLGSANLLREKRAFARVLGSASVTSVFVSVSASCS